MFAVGFKLQVGLKIAPTLVYVSYFFIWLLWTYEETQFEHFKFGKGGGVGGAELV